MIPTAFVLGVVLGGIAVGCLSLPWLTWCYFSCLAIYLLLTLVSAISFNSILMWFVTWLGVIATHFVYGISFGYGWFALKMETKVKAFDHFGDSATGSNSLNKDRNTDK